MHITFYFANFSHFQTSIKMKHFLIAILLAIVLCIAQMLVMVESKKGDTIILGGGGGGGYGGYGGCGGPKLLLKTGKKKKGDIIVINDGCKYKEQAQYIPYPVYHSYGGHDYGHSYGGHGGGYGGYGGHGGGYGGYRKRR